MLEIVAVSTCALIPPQNYLLGGTSSERGSELDDDAKAALIDVSPICFWFHIELKN